MITLLFIATVATLSSLPLAVATPLSEHVTFIVFVPGNAVVPLPFVTLASVSPSFSVVLPLVLPILHV